MARFFKPTNVPSALTTNLDFVRGGDLKHQYLFLQGPHGPFFRELGTRLKKRGAGVLRVNFNGGDWIDWHGIDVINYTGTQQAWPTYVAELISRYQITDLVVYGDCRSIHLSAVNQAKAAGVRVLVFEEGYLRPNWISLEEGGVNGHSTYCQSPEDLLDFDVSKSHIPTPQHVGGTMRWIVFYCLRYYFFKSILTNVFRNYVRHRPYRVYQELLLWIGNLIRMPLLKVRSNRRLKSLKKRNKPYYLVCLQLDSDAQMLVHSNFLSVADFINKVLRSFHANAPAESYLIFKKHPLDVSVIAYETLVKLEAYTLGFRSRVKFLHTGHLPSLIKGSKGVVVVNSTVGTSALHHGKPTIAMGKAIYNLPGLTWQGGIDRFWNEADPPNPAIYEKLRTSLLQNVLINGGFYSRRGRRLALNSVIQRLCVTASMQSSNLPHLIPDVDSRRN